jgi:7-carboxy-7-deazaguanine synthase
MTTLYLVSDLYNSIQGEGCLVGLPMTILRLQGCPVGCPFCDTKYTWELTPEKERGSLSEILGANELWVKLTSFQIANHISLGFSGPKWVLLTGGEPAEQELGDLVAALHSIDRKTALETSGTALGFLEADFDWVCVSPKINMPGGKKVLAEAVRQADEIKYVIGRPKDLEMLEEFLRVFPIKSNTQVCLQPMSLSKKATELCIKTCLERGWRLSVQTHRLLDLP